MPCSPQITLPSNYKGEDATGFFTIATTKLLTVMLSTLADDISVTALKHQYGIIVVTVTYL